MSKLAWHGIVLFAGKVISSLASIAGGIVLARWLSVEDYGVFSQLVLISSTLVFFSNLSLPRSLYFFIPRAESSSEKKHVALQVVAATVISSLLFASLLLPSAPLLADVMQNPAIRVSIVFVAVYLFFLSVSDLFEPFMVSMDQASIVARVETACGIGLFLAVVVPLSLGMDYRNILLCFSAVLCVKIAVMLYHLIRLDGGDFRASLFAGIVKKIQYAAPLALSSMIGIVGRRIDQFIISSMYLPADYAIYARGAFELPLVALIPMTISNLMLPGFAKDFADNRLERVAWQFADKARKVALIFFPLTVLMLILSEAFIVLMFSDKYLGSVSVFRVYLLLLPFRITIHGVVLRAVGKTSIFIAGDLLYILSNIFISLVLIKFVGITGAAWGTVISAAIYTFYISWHNCKLLNINLLHLFPWCSLFMIAFSSVLSGVFILPLILWECSYVVQIVIGTAVFTVGYLIIGYTFRIFTEGDISLVKDLAKEKIFFLRR
ncbi:oligosaccharide flippase family protein [Thermodesulfobacteriota bacterium B35]